MMRALIEKWGFRRLWAVFCFGLISGLPLALTGTTLQAWLTSTGVSLTQIGLLSLVGLPYLFKFLWAPLMDHFPFAMFGSRRKGWILAVQGGLVLVLVAMSSLQPLVQMKAVIVLALLAAFLSASQDISLDAYRTELLNDDERGLGAAVFVFAYRIAVLVSGGLAMILAEALGWQATYLIMAFALIVLMLPVVLAPALTTHFQSERNIGLTTLAACRNLFERDNIILLLCFIVLYKFGDALALSLMTNFLLHGLNFSLTQVGLVYKTVSFVATIGGAMIGGFILKRLDIYRGLWLFGLAQAASNGMFVWLAWVGHSLSLMAASIFIENFCSGLSTAAFFAFLMMLCERRYAATQFAVLSAFSALGRVFSGPLASAMVLYGGWVWFYSWSVLLCLPGLLLLIKIQKHEVVREQWV